MHEQDHARTQGTVTRLARRLTRSGASRGAGEERKAMTVLRRGGALGASLAVAAASGSDRADGRGPQRRRAAYRPRRAIGRSARTAARQGPGHRNPPGWLPAGRHRARKTRGHHATTDPTAAARPRHRYQVRAGLKAQRRRASRPARRPSATPAQRPAAGPTTDSDTATSCSAASCPVTAAGHRAPHPTAARDDLLHRARAGSGRQGDRCRTGWILTAVDSRP